MCKDSTTAQTTVATNSNSSNSVSNVQNDTVKRQKQVMLIQQSKSSYIAQQVKSTADTNQETVPPTASRPCQRKCSSRMG